MRRLGLLAAALTLLLLGVLTLALLALLRAATVADVAGEGIAATATLTTVGDAALLLLIIGSLVHEWLLARQERRRLGTAIPTILVGLICLYTLAFWIFLGPTLYWLGLLTGWRALTEGFDEPESRLARNAVVLAFAALSAWLLVVRYRARFVAGWLAEWYARRLARRVAERGEEERR